jgi:hypothetical protein
MERPGHVGRCPAYTVLALKEGPPREAQISTAFFCDNIRFVFGMTCEPPVIEATTEVAQASLDSLELLGGSVPYVIEAGAFKIEPPAEWVVFDWSGAADPANRAVLELHAAKPGYTFDDLGQYRYPYIRIQWRGAGVAPHTSEALKAVGKLTLHAGAAVVKEHPRTVGRYPAYEWVVDETDQGVRTRWTWIAFVAGGRFFTVRFEGSRDAHGQLLPKVERSLKTFAALR